MEMFSKWICEIPGDNTKDHCKFCKAEILARYRILVKHGESKKHMNAFPFKPKVSITELFNKICDKKAKVA